MSKEAKFIHTLLAGMSDANIEFSDLCKLLSHVGFEERIKGSTIYFSEMMSQKLLISNPQVKEQSLIK